MLEGLSQFLLELHRTSREIPHSGFKDWVFEHLARLIRFDSAWWGSGSERPLQVHRVHLHRCSPRILDEYPRFIEQDFFREAVSRSPGRVMLFSDLMSREAFEQTDIYRNFGRLFRVEWSMGVVLIEPVSSLNEFVTIWRHDARKPFSESDRQMMQAVVPHAFEAHRICRINQLRDPAGTQRATPWALCDGNGLLQDLAPAFVDLIRQEWPQWRDAELPLALRAAIARSRRFTGARVVFELRETVGLLLIEARQRSALDDLTPREMQVSRRYAHGETYIEIAKALGVAPATVRNQIYRSYRKLDVNNKAELVHRLHQVPGTA